MLGASAGLTGFLVVEETYGKLHRGEPLAKPNGEEEDGIDVRSLSEAGGPTQVGSNELASLGGGNGAKELKSQ